MSSVRCNEIIGANTAHSPISTKTDKDGRTEQEKSAPHGSHNKAFARPQVTGLTAT